MPDGDARAGAAGRRADYAPSAAPATSGARIASVEPGSPAWEAGLEPGMRVDAVNGVPLTDIIAWRWEADGATCELDVRVAGEDGPLSCTLEREMGQDWGVEFSDVLFDGVRTCVNACEFCFMSMLPDDARASLSLRDDDYRLSFLQGNFVTLTNVGDADVERIIGCRLSPMNVSLHAVTPAMRRRLIGPHAQRGIDVLIRLLEAGIEVHGQVVVCPGVNDGEELRRTLDWVEPWQTFTSLALVPLGYTKYSRRFSRSFSDDEDAARAVVRLLAPYQRRARQERGITRFQLSDEFYLAARLPVPSAEAYDGYPQFHDGVGMLRSFIDETRQLYARDRARLDGIARSLGDAGRRALLVCGEAALGVMTDLAERWAPGGEVRAQSIRNDYYGGDVNVTGLIVGADLLAQLPSDLSGTVVVLPEVMFNFDRLTLDGDTQGHVMAAIAGRGGLPVVALPAPAAIVDAVGCAIAGG